MGLHRLLYRSDAALTGTDDEINRQVIGIVEKAREANRAAGLTGALLYASGVFIQALEGPLDQIEITFERICCDLRHRRIQLLEFAAAEERVFEEWSMAQITPSRALKSIAPTLADLARAKLEASTASATIALMRTMVVTGSMAA